MRRLALGLSSLVMLPTALAGCGPIGAEGAPRDPMKTGTGGSAGAGGSGGSGGGTGEDDAGTSSDVDSGRGSPPMAPGGYYVDGPTIRDA